jgi:hypothetical protein
VVASGKRLRKELNGGRTGLLILIGWIYIFIYDFGKNVKATINKENRCFRTLFKAMKYENKI